MLGASSGGQFVGSFSQTTDLTVSAIAIQISTIKIHNNSTVPPVLFIHMPQEDHTHRTIDKVIGVLSKRASNFSAIELLCHKKLLIPSFFYDHMSVLSVNDSTALIAGLKLSGLVSRNLTLIDDPRQTEWRQVARTVLPHVVPSKDSLIADESALSELMNLAYAGHEVTDEYLDETFDFFIKHGKQI
mmetsp:Transcript_6967/g.7083  ORF Transcript_6967/g.7083 Transcript_6967/m.7083 type:complete len:187 (-) Transcript_6967:246-806(-)